MQNRVRFIAVKASVVIFYSVHVQLLFGYKCSMYEFIIKFPQFVFLTNFSYKSKFGLPVNILRAEFPPPLCPIVSIVLCTDAMFTLI